MNFRDLNLACPKDDFSLPNIDAIVDLMTCHSIFSLMDGLIGYNKIKISPKDQDKMNFTCAWRIFYWNLISFHLKNAGATHQIAMTTIFHDMMHKIS